MPIIAQKLDNLKNEIKRTNESMANAITDLKIKASKERNPSVNKLGKSSKSSNLKSN